MSLFVAQPFPWNHRIHLGFRHGQLVIRATRDFTTLELIQENIFYKNGQYDLPSALINNCYHWLDLSTKVLEIRQDDIWKSRPSNWKLNLRSRHATRRTSTLIDPFSTVAQTIAQNFQYFEYGRYITVFQPERGRISVELKRLELSFFVNGLRLLQCRELDAEIVPSNLQDIGVWYGLKSKIVLRSMKNSDHRTVLIPEGVFRVRRDGHHVMSFIENSGSYLKYEINNVLGRIESPAEPRLLYTKALWHAYTSYFLPDPLTGRTGMEEALYLLESAMYKPWAPLPNPLLTILNDIAALTPLRNYYPTNMKCMETVRWNENLTTTIQDDRYRVAVERIWRRSYQLRRFQTDISEDASPMRSLGNQHLESRAHGRSASGAVVCDQTYNSQDHRTENDEYRHVMSIAKFLARWPTEQASTAQLASLLQNFPVIGGYIGPFNPVQIFDLISVNIGENWGSLVQSAIEAGPQDKFRLSFLFAPMTLSSGFSMDLINILLAYTVLPSLKSINHPKWPSYPQFRLNEIPAAKDLAELMAIAHQPYISPPEEGGSQRGQRALARLAHEETCKQKCLELAQAIRSQWPQVEVDLKKLPVIPQSFLDVDSALEPALCEYKRIAQNFEYSQYLEAAQLIMDEHTTIQTSDGSEEQYLDGFAESSCGPDRYPFRTSEKLPSIADLLHRSILFKGQSVEIPSFRRFPVSKSTALLTERPNGAVSIKSGKCAQYPEKLPRVADHPTHIEELGQLVKALRTSTSSVQQQYGYELEQSIDALAKQNSQPSVTLAPINPSSLENEIRQAREACNSMLQDICEALETDDCRAKWLKHANLWPSLSKIGLLAELSSTSGTNFGTGTQEALVEWGVQITVLQRLLRIQDASRKNKQQVLHDERINIGHTNWSPQKHVDWLLLEIDSNLLLRVEQVEVANATISPESCENSVVQLLMVSKSEIQSQI
jgi:hypothetical protein